MKECIINASVNTPNTKKRIEKKVPDGMLTIRDLNESLDAEVKTLQIGRALGEGDIGRDKNLVEFVLKQTKHCLLVLFKPRKSITRHAILVDPFQTRTRATENGVIFEPTHGYGTEAFLGHVDP